MSDKAATPEPQVPDTGDSAKKKRKPSGRFECQLGILLGVGGLVGSRLGHLWIAFDVFSQFTLQFAIVTAAFVIGFFMPRARLLAAFIVIIMGLLAIGVWPHAMGRLPADTAAAPAGHREITVASYNTLYSNQNADAVRAEVERLDADIVTLIEMGPNKKPALAALKQRYPHQVSCFTIDFCNLAIISKFPIVETDARVGWTGPPMITAKFGPELNGLTVMGVHTIRFPHSRAQFRQVVALADLIETTPGLKLVTGDFNATPFSRITTTITSRTGLVRLTNLPSWPSNLHLPQVAIDHIFASPSIVQTKAERIGEPAGSDHYPVIVGVSLPMTP